MTEKKKPVSDADVIALNEGIDYLAMTPWGCKAILDRPRGGEWMLQKVCGLPRCEGTPYCAVHLRLYSNPHTMPRRTHG